MAGTARRYKMLKNYKGWFVNGGPNRDGVYGPDPAGASLVMWNHAEWVENEPPKPSPEPEPEPQPEPEPVPEKEMLIESAAFAPESENAAMTIKPAMKRWAKKEKK